MDRTALDRWQHRDRLRNDSERASARPRPETVLASLSGQRRDERRRGDYNQTRPREELATARRHGEPEPRPRNPRHQREGLRYDYTRPLEEFAATRG